MYRLMLVDPSDVASFEEDGLLVWSRARGAVLERDGSSLRR